LPPHNRASPAGLIAELEAEKERTRRWTQLPDETLLQAGSASSAADGGLSHGRTPACWDHKPRAADQVLEDFVFASVVWFSLTLGVDGHSLRRVAATAGR
jgi:hypothetical protein